MFILCFYRYKKFSISKYKITIVLLIISDCACLYHLMFNVFWFVAGYLWVSIRKEPRSTSSYAQNKFFMIKAFSAALAEYIEHIFYFRSMIVWLTDCMIGSTLTILVLVMHHHHTMFINRSFRFSCINSYPYKRVFLWFAVFLLTFCFVLFLWDLF